SWAKFRHPKKGIRWVVAKYWPNVEKRDWTFSTGGVTLHRHRETPIIRPYTKVQGGASPYDGNLLYWSQRLQAHPMTRTRVGRLLDKQQGEWRWWKLAFRDGDRIEVDHMDGKHSKNVPSNLMAVHRHCHDEKHARQEEWAEALKSIRTRKRET